MVIELCTNKENSCFLLRVFYKEALEEQLYSQQIYEEQSLESRLLKEIEDIALIIQDAFQMGESVHIKLNNRENQDR